jgi:hypothetical protein
MSFSASTCLTYTGTTPLGGFITIYSNVSGIPLQVGVPLADITGPNCPYIIEVPDGTTSLTLVDIPTYCEVQIPVISSDFCVTCDLNFDIPLSGTVGVLSVGNLTGSCENPITDYLFTWYGPDSLSTSAFTSAPSYSSYPHQFNHPLTGTSRPPVLAGTYTPILEKIVISGYTFTPTVQNGTIVANLDCFGSVTVSPYTCDNGAGYTLAAGINGVQPASYEHRLQYITNYESEAQPLNATFVLSSTTNYFPFAFKGESVPDTLKITYSGANYPEPYILEYITVGSDLASSNYGLNVMPKSADTANYHRRVLCFTGFTNKQAGDLLTITVEPFSGNTNWDLYFSCLETFTCEPLFNQFENSSYMISGSTISAGTATDGLATTVSLTLSGATFRTNIAGSVGYSDFCKYTTVGNLGEYLITDANGFRNRTFNDMFFPGTYVRSCTPQAFPSDPAPASGYTCTQTLGNLIRFRKYRIAGIGQIDMEFEDINDLNTYYNSYLGKMSLYSGTPFNSLDPDYYRYLQLLVPAATGNQKCGDGFSAAGFRIHTSSVVTTGTTGTGYTMSMTMPTITNDLGAFSGYNCNLWFNGVVINVNNASTNAAVFDYTTLNGIKYNQPFIQVWGVNATGTPPGGGVTATTLYGEFTCIPYCLETYAYTSTTASSLLTSYSAVTCDNYNRYYGISTGRIYPYNIQARLTNPLDTNDFQIWASPINNYVYSGFPSGPTAAIYELVYDYSGGNVIYSSSTYIIG